MIPTQREPGEWRRWESERCCFCRKPTPFWTALEDRTPGQQVACCETCSGLHEPSEVPSKAEWCDSERVKTPRTIREIVSPWLSKGWQR